MSMLNLIGVRFGRLVVLECLESRYAPCGLAIRQWRCICDCGNEITVSTSSLRQGKTKSCGCWLIDSARAKGYQNRKHGGQSKLTPVGDQIRFAALKNIQERSKRRGYETDLELIDIPVVPKNCPVLGIPIYRGSLKNKDNAPSIDRLNPNLPYLKKYRDNLSFISHRANRIKSDASVDELQKIIAYMGSSKRRESSLIDLEAEMLTGPKVSNIDHGERLSEKTPQGDAIARSNENTIVS